MKLWLINIHVIFYKQNKDKSGQVNTNPIYFNEVYDN